MRTQNRAFKFALVGTLLMAAPVFADPPPPAGNVPLPEPDTSVQQGRSPIQKDEGARHFDVKKRERLLQVLQLEDATRAQLAQRLEQLDQKTEDLLRQRKEAFLALREQAKGFRKEPRRGPRADRRAPESESPADPAALKEALNRLYAVEDGMATLRRERLQVGRDLLTPEQQVKFLFFNMKFQKEMRERLEREHVGRDSRPPETPSP